MNNDILELVRQLSLKDKKTLSEKALKLSSECGELASKALSYDNLEGCSRFVTREQILDEVADNILVALSIAYSLDFKNEDISSMMKDKAIHWSHLKEQDISDGKYPFEIHLTVLVKSLEGFEKMCNEWGDVKPILIYNYYGNDALYDIQVTTSTVIFGSFTDAVYKMRELVSRLQKNGVEIYREKIETVPWHPAINAEFGLRGKYFESHAVIWYNINQDIKDIIDRARKFDLYISMNAFKLPDADGNYKVMATRRSHINEDWQSHREQFDMAMHFFSTDMIVTKTITEYAIVDSNQCIDDRWLNKI